MVSAGNSVTARLEQQGRRAAEREFHQHTRSARRPRTMLDRFEMWQRTSSPLIVLALAAVVGFVLGRRLR
ncbi:MAG TPA: hypothetical protein VG713_13255 [Pirellulales bacterium]|nr:hypothetical protein [Pirellulales bacterium]